MKFSHFREKSPPYALDYTNPINNINYETINNLKNKEILINNENAHLLVEKNALEKNLKKHSMFINALSWKKFNSSKKKSVDSSNKNKGLAFRPPLDNIHPLVDNNRNIQNALCHGSKSTSLAETKRNLDIVRTSASSTAAGTGGEARKTSGLGISKTQQLQQHGVPATTTTTSTTLLTSQKISNISHSNSLNNNTLEQPLKTTQTRRDDNEEILKKRQSTANKLEPLTAKPGPKKTVIQVKVWPD